LRNESADSQQENETIRGVLSCAPNARNNRDLDIIIDYEVTGNEPTKGSMTYKM
jgi:protein arginine N-methyltransferase 1